MSLDEKLLLAISKSQTNLVSDCVLVIDKKQFFLSDLQILRELKPVSKPTMRGGVYISGHHVFKLKAITNDLSLIPLLSKSMLGPNTEFKELELRANLQINGEVKDITFFTNLTNMMQSSSRLQLNMILVKMKIN